MQAALHRRLHLSPAGAPAFAGATRARLRLWPACLRAIIRGMTGGWVYIVTNKPHGVLYTGVTSDLAARMVQHRDGTGSKFACKHHCIRLVYAERHERIEDAIAREKAVKEWHRLWKLRLIQESNPIWADLFETLGA